MNLIFVKILFMSIQLYTDVGCRRAVNWVKRKDRGGI